MTARASAVVALLVLAAGCRNFQQDLSDCIAQGRCVDDAGAAADGGGAIDWCVAALDAGWADAGGIGVSECGFAPDGGPVPEVTAAFYLLNITEAPAPTVRFRPAFADSITAVFPLPDGGDLEVTSFRVDAGLVGLPGIDAGTFLLRRNFAFPTDDAGALIPQSPLYAQYVETSERFVDFSEIRAGRTNLLVAEPDSGTALDLRLTNLAPWAPDDDLQLASPGAGVGYYSFVNSGNVRIDAGATGVSAVVPWEVGALAGAGRLIDTNEGDQVFLLQLHSTTMDGGVRRTAIARAYSPGTLVMASGTTAQLSGTMQAPAPALRMQIDHVVHVAEFDALAPQVHRTAQALGRWLYVDPLFASVDYGFPPNGAPDIGFYSLPGADGGQSCVPIHDTLDNPFTYETAVGLYWRFGVELPLPDGGVASVEAAVTGMVPFDQFPPHIVPQLSPVQSVRIANRQTNVDTVTLPAGERTPLLTWAAPAIGEPTLYLVGITDVSGAAPEGIATFVTRNLQLRIPSGVLEGGKAYWVRITAVRQPGCAEKQPYRYPLPRWTAPWHGPLVLVR